MSAAGPFSPSSFTNVDPGFLGAVIWNSETGAAASDDAPATVPLGFGETSYFLRCTGFGITNGDVPPGATIDGILVEVEASQDGDAQGSSVYLVYDSSQIGSNLAGFSPYTPDGTDAYYPLGGETETGGSGVTQAMIVDASFGIDIGFNVPFFGSGSNVFVDHVRLTVYYTEGGGGPSSSATFQAMIIG